MFRPTIDFSSVRARLGMWISRPSFVNLVAWLNGIDFALDGGLLTGFRERLVVIANHESTWPKLILKLVDSCLVDEELLLSFPELEQKAINTLFDQFEEFLLLRGQNDGIRTIYCEYQIWLERQSWYTPGSPHWIEIEESRRKRKKISQGKTKPKVSRK
jgi:hypothetical protein